MIESRARYTSQEAVEKIGNRYDLVIIASHRARELKRGYLPKVITTSGPIVTALIEVEQGKIGREYLKRTESTRKKDVFNKDRYK